MLQVPGPPLPLVTPVNVNICPAQTVAVFGDLAAEGDEGSATTVNVTQMDEVSVQPPPDTRHLY